MRYFRMRSKIFQIVSATYYKKVIRSQKLFVLI